MSAQNQVQPTTSIPQKPPAWFETLLGKLSSGPEPTKAMVAALNDNYSENPGAVNKIQREIQQSKDMIQNLCRETDARIRGLARRNQSSRNEQPPIIVYLSKTQQHP